jgi:hypothetical protein
MEGSLFKDESQLYTDLFANDGGTALICRQVREHGKSGARLGE